MDYLRKKLNFKMSNDDNINLNQVPYVILSNFESLNEKRCISADKHNDKIYKKLLDRVKLAEKSVKNTGLFLNLEVPLPPHPSNRDRFLLWTKRNVNHHVITQSESVIFLHNNGYILNEHYEAYQAIELAKEIRKQNGLPNSNNDDILKSKNFENIYTSQDKNIFRRRSMYGKTQFRETRDLFKEDRNIVVNDINENCVVENKSINQHQLMNNSNNYPYNLNKSINITPSAPSAPPPCMPKAFTNNDSNDDIYPGICDI